MGNMSVPIMTGFDVSYRFEADARYGYVIDRTRNADELARLDAGRSGPTSGAHTTCCSRSRYAAGKSRVNDRRRDTGPAPPAVGHGVNRSTLPLGRHLTSPPCGTPCACAPPAVAARPEARREPASGAGGPVPGPAPRLRGAGRTGSFRGSLPGVLLVPDRVLGGQVAGAVGEGERLGQGL